MNALAMLAAMAMALTPSLAGPATLPERGARPRRGSHLWSAPTRDIPCNDDAHLDAAEAKRARKAARRLAEAVRP
jgi:hypothetical protein